MIYEAKVPTSDGYKAIQNCSHAIEKWWNLYLTPALSNEVYNIALAQETQKLSAIKS